MQVHIDQSLKSLIIKDFGPKGVPSFSDDYNFAFEIVRYAASIESAGFGFVALFGHVTDSAPAAGLTRLPPSKTSITSISVATFL